MVAQVARAQGVVVHVLTRSEQARGRALALGVASAGPADGEPPEPLDPAILFAPAGELVPTVHAVDPDACAPRTQRSSRVREPTVGRGSSGGQGPTTPSG
ncbi:hypothetical protein PSU4_25950 [Pseudonocardia sulfidoxydans NBRC 16205]|uniref:Uncharacterized protein n=1 Tax=Pseudonocardia sulfidoxydans NBRC 16205 TaxID=1223511 RepID=A0A511DFS9_9PSEU|nr:hypothetical protein PSU4_25950 [Pseudonocardia sulfidoxydans NBRC 16205]